MSRHIISIQDGASHARAADALQDVRCSVGGLTVCDQNYDNGAENRRTVWNACAYLDYK